MRSLQKLSLAFTSGAVGAGALMLTKMLALGPPDSIVTFKQNLYHLLVWGGIWALLLALPILKKQWLWRGLLIAFVVIMFNFAVLMPLTGRGFFAMQASSIVFWSNICFNTVWGVVAAAWYALTVKN